MLHQISWANFFECLFFLLLAYYAVIGIVYYRKDLQAKFMQYQQHGMKRQIEKAVADTPVAKVDNIAENRSNSAVHDLLEELKTVWANAAKKSMQKEELLMALQLLFKKYPSIKNTPFQTAINNQIIRECTDVCSIELQSNDLTNCW